MPAWLLAILVPLVEKLAEKVGKFLINSIKDSINDSEAKKEYDAIKDPQAKAAYIKSLFK